MLYAGFDCSTQSLTVVVIDASRRTVVFRDSIAYEEPFFRPAEASLHKNGLRPANAGLHKIGFRPAEGGLYKNGFRPAEAGLHKGDADKHDADGRTLVEAGVSRPDDSFSRPDDSFSPPDDSFSRPDDDSIVHASPQTWATALAAMLERLARSIDCSSLRAISGSAQQHGSVYCGATPEVLTRPTAPIWMDSSTRRECDEIEEALGGAEAVAQLTGSRAFPRFTGPQIRKFARDEPKAYARTKRIHLVSSYLASLLIGRHAPIDHADGSGMNLMDIRTREWSDKALRATAPGLLDRLPQLVPSATVIGTLHDAWQDRSCLPATRVVAWSGDNPCSLVGTGLTREGDLCISLGTSDTVFGPMDQPRVSRDGTGHVFASPLGTYMGITVFSNGSLARERVRDDAGLDWQGFSEALRRTRAGNDGAIMFPWFVPEITPVVSRATAPTLELSGEHPDCRVRAIIEGQAMAMWRHSKWMGVSPRVIQATGGAAANPEILQVIADVFDAEVRRFESTDSAALGAALRALQADTGRPWNEVLLGFVEAVPGSPIRPIASHVAVYRSMGPIYAAREAETLRMMDAPGS